MAGTTHIVKTGECIATIAAKYGVPWKTVWDAPENATLRRTRTDPNVLAAGDKVVVPKPKVRQESVQTGKNNKFVVKREKIRLFVRLTANGQPLTNEPWKLTCGDRVIEGSTDGEGIVEAEVVADSSDGTLELIEKRRTYKVVFDELDPIDTIRGAQTRLYNMGIYRGEVSGTLDDTTRSAVELFQQMSKITVTGKCDAATQRALAKAAGC